MISRAGRTHVLHVLPARHHVGGPRSVVPDNEKIAASGHAHIGNVAGPFSSMDRDKRGDRDRQGEERDNCGDGRPKDFIEHNTILGVRRG